MRAIKSVIVGWKPLYRLHPIF